MDGKPFCWSYYKDLFVGEQKPGKASASVEWSMLMQIYGGGLLTTTAGVLMSINIAFQKKY